MRILFITDNFVPEQNAPALRTYEHCRRWIGDGVQVTVITTVPNFPVGKPQAPYRNRLYQRENIHGIHVVRVWSFLAANRGVFRRMLDFASFSLTSFLAGLFEPADVIVATSPQLLTAVSGRFLALLKRRPWILEIRDLWPDSIVAVGAIHEGRTIRLLRRLEKYLYRTASHIITLTEPMRAILASRGIAQEKIGLVPNGANPSRLTARVGDERLAERWQLTGKFVVGYVGTHGMAQGLRVMIEAANILKATDVQFLFVGDGARREAHIGLARELNLNNVRFIGLVPAEDAPEFLALSDAVVVPLKKMSISESAIPSKIFEAAAMERPILLGVGGIAADIVRGYNAGLVFEPEDPESLADAILLLRSDQALQERLRAGCRALARAYDRNNLADQMLAQIRAVARL